MKNTFNRGRENKTFAIALGLGVLLFGVFFTSKLWMYDDTAIAQTPYNESIGGLNQTTIILREWEYNPGNQLMEVTLETVHTGSDVVKPTFTFKAEGKDSGETYPAQKVYESDHKMVIQIENVPESYRVIGLFITEHRDEEILKQEYQKHVMHDKNAATSADEELPESELPEPEDVIIVGDYRKITINKALVTKTDKTYKKETILAEMERIKNKIHTLIDERIPFQKDLIETLEKEIKSLQKEMKFETKKEKAETKKAIEQKESSIHEAKDRIKNHQEKIKNLKAKYQSRQEKLDALTQTKEEKKQQRDEKKAKKAANKDSDKKKKDSKKEEKNHASSTKKKDKDASKEDSKKKKDESKKKKKSSS